MDVQHGIKSSVLPMDSSFRAALKETAASNDKTFSSTSNSVLCVNAKKRKKKKKRKGMGKEERMFQQYVSYILIYLSFGSPVPGLFLHSSVNNTQRSLTVRKAKLHIFIEIHLLMKKVYAKL